MNIKKLINNINETIDESNYDDKAIDNALQKVFADIDDWIYKFTDITLLGVYDETGILDRLSAQDLKDFIDRNTDKYQYQEMPNGEIAFAPAYINLYDEVDNYMRNEEDLDESVQKNEDFKHPKTHDELKPGEWYEVDGSIYQIDDHQPRKDEIWAFKVYPDHDYQVGQGTHAFYKIWSKPDHFHFVNKKSKITERIKEKREQLAKLKQEVAKLKQEIDTLKGHL